MSLHQHATLADTVYFWFASNDTSGSGDDGASPLADVRLAGAASDAAPVLSPTPTLLSHVNYPAGCHEVAVAATEGNGFAAGNTYAVFCTLTVDSQNPTGFVGSFTLAPISADVIKISGDSTAADNLELDYVATGYAKTNSTIGTATDVTNRVTADMTYIHGTALTETDGRLAGRFTDFFDQASATFSVATALSSFMATCLDAAGIRTAVGMASANLDTQLGTFSTHDAAAVVTALGTGSTLTDCLTATGFATAAALTTHDGKLDDVDTVVDTILLDTAELQTDDVPGLIGALNNVSAADVNAQCDAAIETYHLDHLLAVEYDPASKPGVATALLNEIIENDGGVSRLTENALEQAPSGSGASAAAIADAVWDEASAGHTDAGKAGQQLWTDIDALVGGGTEVEITTEGTNIITDW